MKTLHRHSFDRHCLPRLPQWRGNAAIALPKSKPPPARGKVDFAQFQLARAFLRGQGVHEDPLKPFELMKQAAGQGHPEAIGGIGYFHANGIAVERDSQEAIKWFRMGAEVGSAKSQLNLGRCLLEVRPQESNVIHEGLDWIRKAADQGLAEAALSYGRFLYAGEHGLTRNYQKAIRYFKIAADQGDPDALNFLGVMHNLGLGVAGSPEAAAKWFRMAARRGHLKAQANLGRLLNPLSPDKEQQAEAIAWLMIAADQGEVMAVRSLEDATPALSPEAIDRGRRKSNELRREIRGDPAKQPSQVTPIPQAATSPRPPN